MPTFGTVVNPTRQLADYLSTHASNSLAQSLIAVATPNFAAQLRDLKSNFPRLQTVGLATDTVPLGCQRSGFSFLVSELPLHIKSRQELLPDLSRNWSPSTSAFRLTGPANFDLAVPAANTLFSTGRQAEIYANDDVPLTSLHAEIEETFKLSHSIKPAKPLTEWLEISGAADNMLKSLNEKPAAGFLEEKVELMESKDPQVFAELESGEMVRVVAGGGGLWSPKASMLVLEAPASPRRGQMLRFWLQQGTMSSDLESQLASTTDGVVAEAAPVPQTHADEKPYLDYKKNHFLDVFGFGSELGFMVGTHKHAIVGESAYFRL